MIPKFTSTKSRTSGSACARRTAAERSRTLVSARLRKAWRCVAIVRQAQIAQTRADNDDDLEAIGLPGSGMVFPFCGFWSRALRVRCGANPFTAGVEVSFPNTIGELIAFYEHVAA